jgi:fatty-acyl-CoA synthase
MAAIQLRVGSTGSAGAVDELATSLASFLVAQPDLGTKMPPRFVRFVARMPVTATYKTAKTGLRAERWDAVGADLVLWWPYRRRADAPLTYRRFEPADRKEFAALFAEHGRADLISRNQVSAPERSAMMRPDE